MMQATSKKLIAKSLVRVRRKKFFDLHSLPFAKCSMLIALCSLIIFLWGCSTGPRHYIRKNVDFSTTREIAVLPFENFTPDAYAGEKIRGAVISELLLRGMSVIEPGEVTRVLRELKIRSLGSIKVTDIQDIGKTLGSEVLMMGSVETFGISRGISVSYPEVSINLRLVEVSSGNIIWSVWHTSGGPSFWTRHFGAEGITLSEAASKVVREAVDTLL